MALTATTPLYNSTVTVIWVMTLYCYTTALWLLVPCYGFIFGILSPRYPYVEFSLRKI
jgi:hypothetical protein